MIILLILGACGGESKEAEAHDVTIDVPTGPYIVADTDPVMPTTDAATLAEGMTEALMALFAFDLNPIETGYTQVMAEADEDCPIWAIDGESVYWYASCTSDLGTSFNGYGTLVDYATLPPEDGIHFSGTMLNTIATISSFEGEHFSGGGAAFNIQATNNDGYELAYMGTDGGFEWSGPEAEGSWMRAATSLDFIALMEQNSEHKVLQIEGTISGLSAVDAVVFSGLTAVNTILPDGCGPEPHGMVAIRDIEGHWFDLEFQGMDDQGALDTTNGCDQCATAWFEGRPLFEVCPVMDLLYAWSL